MALRRIDIHRVQHLRCKVQHPSKMTKQCRTTFRNEGMDLKHCSTMVHHSPAMVNHRPATGIPFYRKNPRDEKMKGKKLPWPDWGSDRIFGYETKQWRLKAVIDVELKNTFVLTGCGSRNSKRAKSYGPSKNQYQEGATSTVQGATSVQNDETVPYDLEKWVLGFETLQYHGASLSSDGKS